MFLKLGCTEHILLQLLYYIIWSKLHLYKTGSCEWGNSHAYENNVSPPSAHYSLHISLKQTNELFLFLEMFICLSETNFIVLVQHAFGLALLLPLPLDYRFTGVLFRVTFSLILRTLQRNPIYTVVPDIAPPVKAASSCSANYDNEHYTRKSK